MRTGTGTPICMSRTMWHGRLKRTSFVPLRGTVKLYCHPAVYTGVQSRYYVNEGDGAFVDRTEAAGFMPTLGKSLGVAELDFNFDGWPDLAVANDGEGDLLFRNNADGTFTNIGRRAGLRSANTGKHARAWVLTRGSRTVRGVIPLYVGNFSGEMIGAYRHVEGESFIDRAALSRIGFPSLLSLTFGLFLMDVDMDTDLDLFAANGHVHPDRTGENDRIRYRQPAQLFLNRGDGVFDEFTPEEGGMDGYARRSRGRLCGLRPGRGPGYSSHRERRSGAFMAQRYGSRALSACACRGAREQSRRSRNPHYGQAGRIDHGTAHSDGVQLSCASEPVAAFGLGSREEVDSLTVYWPGGLVEHFADVAGDRDVLLIEGTGDLTPIRPHP